MWRDEPTSSAVLLPTYYRAFIDPKVEITRKKSPLRVYASEAVARNCSYGCRGYKWLDSIKTFTGLLSLSGNVASVEIKENGSNKECGYSSHVDNI